MRLLIIDKAIISELNVCFYLMLNINPRTLSSTSEDEDKKPKKKMYIWFTFKLRRRSNQVKLSNAINPLHWRLS